MLCIFLPSDGRINNERVCNTQSMYEMYVDFQR